MLSRHGSRYPTLGSNVQNLGRKLAEHPEFKSSDALAFLNDWKYELGYEILVPRGRQELFESGINHYYRYAQLYNPNSKIIVRTTTQDRMLKVSCILGMLVRGLTGVNRVPNTSCPASLDWNGQTMPQLRS
jgi:hypothetical protein